MITRIATVMLLALLIAAADSAAAQTLPAPSPPFASATPQAVPPTTVSGIGNFLFEMQRRINRDINRQLAAIARGETSGALWGGIVIALLYGVFHAIGPGHGKTVILGYFLGREARPWRGIGMAFWLAGTHVAAAFLLVLGARFLLAPIAATAFEDMRGLRAFSYGLIFLIGIVMLRRAWLGDSCAHHAHGHSGESPRQNPPMADGRSGKNEQRILAIAAGFIPCSGAILILAFTIGHGLYMAGAVLVAAIALGMGATLSAVGLGSILLRRQLTARFGSHDGAMDRWKRSLALTGSGLVAAIGAFLLAGIALGS